MARKFYYNGARLEDPDPAKSPDEVRRYYAGIHAALTNAGIVGPTKKDGADVYEFKVSVGTKG